MVDMKLEVDFIPVSDVDRAARFYESLGWRKDVTPPGIVQLTPPGSWCSVQFGKNLTSAAVRFGERVLDRRRHRGRQGQARSRQHSD